MNNLEKGLNEHKSRELIDPEKSIEAHVKQSDFAAKLLQREFSFLERMFPGAVDKAAIQYQKQLSNQEGQHNLNMHRIMSEFRLKGVKEAANQVLQNGLVKARENAAHTYTDKIQVLQEKMDQVTLVVTKMIDKALEELPTIKSDVLRQRREAYLLKEIDKFYDVVEYIMDDFRNITQSLIK